MPNDAEGNMWTLGLTKENKQKKTNKPDGS